MTPSNAYLDSVLAHLAQVADISHRRIFSGVSLYCGNLRFALVVNDRLYFHTDEHSRPLYQQHGMSAFQPRLATQAASRFYQVPNEVFHQPAELRHWLRIAVESVSPTLVDDGNSNENREDNDYSSSHSPLDTSFIPRQVRA
jgi:DNA transformation protein